VREGEAHSREIRDAYQRSATASRQPTPAFFSPQSMAQDSFLFECMRVLEHAYPSPSFATAYARASAVALVREEAEAALDRSCTRRQAEDARGGFLRGKRLREFLAKHGPSEFPLVRGRGADGGSLADAQGRRRPHALRTGSSNPPTRWDQLSPTSTSTAANLSPVTRGRFDSRAGTGSTLFRSVSGPDRESAGPIADPSPVTRGRSGDADLGDM